MGGDFEVHSQDGAASARGAERAHAGDWARFAAARDEAEFDKTWLALLCAQIAHVESALLVRGSAGQGGFAAAASWPGDTPGATPLMPVAERALASGRGDIRGAVSGALPPRPGEPVQLAYPITVDGHLRGAVALQLHPAPTLDLQRAPRQLHWASAWLVERIRAAAMQPLQAELARMQLAGELLATATQHRRLGTSTLALANEVAARLRCHRVSVGFEQGGSIDVQTLSHTASFDAQSNEVRLINQAMEEALDAGMVLHHPTRVGTADDEDSPPPLAQQELAEANGMAGVVSAPLMAHGRTVGVLTLERADAPFDAAEVATLRALGLMLGPVLALKRENERGLPRRAFDASRAGVHALTGPGHPGAKLGAVLATALLCVPMLLTSPYRVSARSVVEGETQRSSVVPFQGVLAESHVRAGDTVRAGQLLARMQDRELVLEHARWAAEEDLADRRYRQAAAERNRSEMAQAQARIAQAAAQRQLTQEQLARAQVLAPFDGVVVSGDGRGLVGTPLEAGKLLFEIAPLDRYRVMLEVDERDIAAVRKGQRGELALTGLTGERVAFEVAQVTPVSTARDGRNFYRVEAQTVGDSQASRSAQAGVLRPGMEGVGKISVGDARLWWIWTHGLTDWLRLAFWKWMP
ncbi:HlyD family efflux transporter periplasmic adaptor subunit [Roseateles sp. LYH14W]|uniref:HlyD family efflux transporter periplasmic adaptor subunit n=1 Tax=Pelomonas parva TaxID=3299032 RepID=A0ABW7F9Y0_9BURK